MNIAIFRAAEHFWAECVLLRLHSLRQQKKMCLSDSTNKRTQIIAYIAKSMWTPDHHTLMWLVPKLLRQS